MRLRLARPWRRNVVRRPGWVGTIIPSPASGYIKEFNGTTWLVKPVKTSTGAIKPMKQYNGSAWITLHS